jgi:hypothetical protein
MQLQQPHELPSALSALSMKQVEHARVGQRMQENWARRPILLGQSYLFHCTKDKTSVMLQHLL